jgi:alkylation response protein AidB-like acyl-CoA dehydrogenase
MSGTAEDVESFRLRAREWIRASLGPAVAENAQGLRAVSADDELAAVAHDRALQRALHEAGLNGLVVPREYGGQGLTAAHQRALNEELSGYEWPSRFQVPTMAPCAAVLLEFGTEEQSGGTSRRSCAARRSSCSSCPSRAAARTWPGRSPPPSGTAMTGC